MPQYTDQMGNSIQLDEPPRRIISLVPSQSEFLWDLGLQKELKGITKFCIHPEEMFRSVERVGGTKNLNLDKIRLLLPDLIIGNKEENDQAQIEELKKDFKVWMSDISTLEDAYEMMTSLSEITGKTKPGRELIFDIQSGLNNCKGLFPNRSVLYLIWKDPYMCAAKNTFIDHMLSHVGLTNAAAQLTRYPELSSTQLQNLDPDICLLSSEPFPFKEVHIEEIRVIIPRAKVQIVDGEMFSWYGSRLLQVEDYIKRLVI